MKKIGFLIAILAITSCKKETADYAIISGKISNSTVKEITLFGITDRSTRQTITLADDGSFNDTIKKTGEFLLSEARNRTTLYLNKGNNIKVNYNAKEHKNSLIISGKGSGISNYLLAKEDISSNLMGKGTEIYTKDEADYKKVMKEIKARQENLLAKSKEVSANFKTKEKRNINYSYLEKLNRFKSYHSYYAKKPDYIPSEEFLTDLNDIAYDNEEDFIFSANYKSLVTAHYKNKAKDLKIEGDDEYNSLAMLKICKDIKSQAIKNNLAFNAVQYPITYTNNVEGFYKAYKAVGTTNEKNNADIEKKYSVLKNLVKGAASPKFIDYENNAGGTTSLDDLKGKYTYIDIWATWCGPCLAEIPSLKKIEKKYHGKNIQFLSISIDDKKDHQKWKDMIKDKKLGGIQLFADNVWKSKFVADYYVKGIPKFILLDPKGNIVVPNAPRPSDDKLVDLLNELKI
ncbi:Thiol:disulfide interchange protein TlpA [Polaribacter huanghezhanensis]|uniref:TlpA family protein disulfide reductase n=1 Tax=Polaribacter huanghezhanensis TaxID=1354726 RepID=UPI002648EE71|nr:TlpA disulfide reductase family protein [Polaribacter huanghezhanensis]WKD85769.1 Thiol:disulfide interchange protein TlpA [Polaribacter huanghezhanensis]